MTAQDYKLIAASVRRSGIIPDKNRVRQLAKEGMRHLIAVDLAANFSHLDPDFDRDQFMKDCGYWETR